MNEHDRQSRELCYGHIVDVFNCSKASPGKCEREERLLTWCVLSHYCPAEAAALMPCMRDEADPSVLTMKTPISLKCRYRFGKVLFFVCLICFFVGFVFMAYTPHPTLQKV